jgi:hypothetical protein
MKTRLAWLVLIAVVTLVSIGGCVGIPVKEVREINGNWYNYYNQDRKPTPEEAAEYEALTPEEQEAWELEGKPVPGYLDPDYLDATQQYYDSVETEMDLAEKEKEDDTGSED